MPATTAKKKPAAKKTTPANASKEFAVIATGGKQYPVAVGDTLRIEKLPGEVKKGDTVTFDKVLLVDNGTDTTIGTPYIKGAIVTGEVITVGRLPKVTVIKYKQKSRYFKKNGHRQPYLKVKINTI
ncbi:MAG TPA: 50S ribosomal protein L21 [Candidatus Paceibacterota bacterium]|nr:50S ribosomal protein L21 [Candidatus Paceibacterota bacterium]